MILLAAAALSSIISVATGRCDDQNTLRPAVTSERAAFKRLGELPSAAHYLTVFRTIDRCPEPVIVRYGIGNATPELAPLPR